MSLGGVMPGGVPAAGEGRSAVSPVVAGAPPVVAGRWAARVGVWAVGLVPLSFVVDTRELPGGVHVVQAVVAGAVLVVVAARLVSRVRGRGLPAVLVVAGLVVVSALLSTALAAVAPAAAVRLCWGYLLGWLFAVAVAAAVRRAGDLLGVLACLAVGGGAVCLTGLGGLSALQSYDGGAVVLGRPTGVLAQPNELGLMAGVTVVCGLAVLGAGLARRRAPAMVGGVARRRALVLVGAACGVVGALVLAASLSRGAWLGTGLGVLVLLVLVPRLRRPALLAVGGVAAVVLVLLVASGLGLGSVVYGRLGTLTAGGGNPYDQRPQLWALALRDLAAHPLLGLGPGGFPAAAATNHAVTSAEGGPDHAHSLLLTVAAEQGLLGVLALLAVVVVAVYRVGRTVRATGTDLRVPLVAAATAAALAVLLGQGIVDYPLRNPVLAVLGWLLVGLLAAATDGDRPPQPDRKW